MIEVNGQPAPAPVARPTSPKGSAEINTGLKPGGNGLPQDDSSEAKLDRVEVSRETLSEAVTQMNQYVQLEQRDLRFSIDEGSGRTVVRVLDRHSGDLIRQIPNEVFLDMARRAKEDDPVHLINVHG